MSTAATIEQVANGNLTAEEVLWLTAFDRYMTVTKLDQFSFMGSAMAGEAINFSNVVVQGFKTFRESSRNGT